MTLDELEAAKRKADMDDKMKAMIREILFYALLLFFLLIVINGQQDTDSYRQNANIISLFNKCLKKDVSDHTLILTRLKKVKGRRDIYIPPLTGKP